MISQGHAEQCMRREKQVFNLAMGVIRFSKRCESFLRVLLCQFEFNCQTTTELKSRVYRSPRIPPTSDFDIYRITLILMHISFNDRFTYQKGWKVSETYIYVTALQNASFDTFKIQIDGLFTSQWTLRFSWKIWFWQILKQNGPNI